MKKTTTNTKLIVKTVIEKLRELNGFESGVPEELIEGCGQSFLKQHRRERRSSDCPMETVDEFMDSLRDAGLVSLFPSYDEVEFTCRVVEELAHQGLIEIVCTGAELRSTIAEEVARAAACREEKLWQTTESLERLVRDGQVEITIEDGVRRYRLVDGAVS